MNAQNLCGSCFRIALLMETRADGVGWYQCPVGHSTFVAPPRGRPGDGANELSDELTPWQRARLESQR